MNRKPNLVQELKEVKTVTIAGHIRPDGDAVGSCMGLYLYLKENYPQMDVKVYLEKIPEAYSILSHSEEICHSCEEERNSDLFFCLDCGDEQRLGEAAKYKKSAGRTICVDHHISNEGFCDVNYIVPEASSTSELIYTLLEEKKISREAAEALYMGIVHDTGVFRHSNTTPETMETAAALLRKGIDGSRIINQTFYDKTYYQNQILGRALLESILLMDGKIIFSAVRRGQMAFYGVGPSDLDGIVQTLMSTTGTEAAIFMYETQPQVFKVSLRSRDKIDVSVIAGYFGGGGHVHAAGCTMQGTMYDVVNNITYHMEKQLLAAEGAEEAEDGGMPSETEL